VAKIPIAVQMYTLRDVCGEDFIGTLKAVAEIGYHGVELAGTYGIAAEELGTLLKDLGLGCAGTHIGIDALENEFDKTVEFYRAVGTSFLTIPGLPGNYTESAEAWKRTADLLTVTGRKLKEEGFQLSYHNHSHEFTKFDGEYGLDILYQNSDPDALHAQIDTYWVQHGGEDPADYMKKLGKRMSVIHLKDMADDDEQSFAEIGNGILDWERIFKVAEDAGVKWYSIEQDTCPGPTIDSVRISFENLKGMGQV
jgi:sugar phosphate isomerase/epimerase